MKRARMLYIGRYYPDEGAGLITRLRRKKTRYLKLRGQCGFMRASLHTVFDVKEADLAYLRARGDRVARDFDYLMVCSKSDSSGEGFNQREFDFLDRIKDIPKALFVSNPEAGFMPDDACLDRFDVVFKREHFSDLDRYPISAANQSKIRLAWLDCPLVPARRFNVRRIEPQSYGFMDVSRTFDADVCFYGSQSSRLRPKVWKAILDSDLTAHGGIQGHDIDPDVDPRVFTPGVGGSDYIRSIRRSRVNLALEGIGEFTHRHWELWLLCAFCLSSPSVRELALPGGAREYEHFVCFDSVDDLVDKVRYYAARDAERDKIAIAGRRLFEETFDFARYGEFVRACMDAPDTI